MVNFLLNPVGGFFLTLFIFVLCVFLVLGAKSSLTLVKKYLPKKQSPAPVTERKPKATRRKKSPSPVRSIEINPDEIDRIYVKKIS